MHLLNEVDDFLGIHSHDFSLALLLIRQNVPIIEFVPCRVMQRNEHILYRPFLVESAAQVLYLSHVPSDPKSSLSTNVDLSPTLRNFLLQTKDEGPKDVYSMSRCTNFVAEVRHKVTKKSCEAICKHSIQ